MRVQDWDREELPRRALVRGFPDGAYHSLQHISSSMIRLASGKSIKHMLAGSTSTPAMLLGSIVHELVLQPDAVTYCPLLPEVPKPEGMDMRRKEWKDWAQTPEGEEWAAEVAHVEAENERRRASGKVVSDSVWQRGEAMAQSIQTHEHCEWILDGAERELTAVSEIEGVPVRARFDILNRARFVMADIKKTQDASLTGFAKSIANYGYHVQAAWYRRVWTSLGLDANAFTWQWIAVEDSPTADVAVYQASDDLLDTGDIEIDEIWPEIVRWYNQGASYKDAPGYPVQPRVIELPRWAQRRRNAPRVTQQEQEQEAEPWEF